MATFSNCDWQNANYKQVAGILNQQYLGIYNQRSLSGANS